MSQATTTAKLNAALVAAQKAAHAVEKDSKNKHFNYKYASSEDIIQESRQALGPHGLAFTPISYAVAVREDESGGMLSATYVLVHESGEERQVTSMTPVVPEKGRPIDKAVAVAKTYDLSYTLRGLLLLPRIEEGAEVDTRDDRDYVPPQRQHKDLDDKLSAFVDLIGEERCREIVGEYPRTLAEKAEALRKLEAAQSKAVRDSAPHGSSRQAAPPQSGDSPPTKLRSVPKADEAQQAGQPASKTPQAAQSTAANGAKSDSRNGNGSQSMPELSSKEFWDRVKAAAGDLTKARKAICERWHLQDAGRASRPQWMMWLEEVEEAKAQAAQEGGAR
jgi:hypothetical protein